MGCASCAGIGHFAAYVPGGERQYYKTTGQVIGAPNETAGMHTRISRAGVQGLGDFFGPNQTNWISGVPNEYVALGAAAVVVLMMMR